VQYSTAFLLLECWILPAFDVALHQAKGKGSELENLITKVACRKNSSFAYVLKLQNVRSLVACDEVVCLDGFGKVEQVAIGGIVGGVKTGKWLSPNPCTVQVVDQYPKTIWLQRSTETRIPAGLANLFDLIDAGGKLKSLLTPSLMELRWWSGWGKDGAEEHVRIEYDQH
jgi:hypothetical protein